MRVSRRPRRRTRVGTCQRSSEAELLLRDDLFLLTSREAFV